MIKPTRTDTAAKFPVGLRANPIAMHNIIMRHAWHNELKPKEQKGEGEFWIKKIPTAEKMVTQKKHKFYKKNQHDSFPQQQSKQFRCTAPREFEICQLSFHG